MHLFVHLLIHSLLHAFIHSQQASSWMLRLQKIQKDFLISCFPFMEDLSLAAHLEPMSALDSWAGLQLKVRLAQPPLQEVLRRTMADLPAGNRSESNWS